MRTGCPLFGWIAYALIWLAIIALVLSFPIIVGQMGGEMILEGWPLLAFVCLVLAVWLLVLWRRLSLRWLGALKWPALVFAIMSITHLLFSIVMTIGVGKLLIGGWGRWSMFDRSHLKTPGMAVAPRGLLEHRNNED